MIHTIKQTFLLLAVLLFAGSCGKDDYKMRDLATPGKPVVTLTITGKDATHPNGDGSGTIQLSISAEHAYNYKVDFGDGKPAKFGTVNTFSYTYDFTGTKKLTITVMASGSAGITSSTTVEAEIYRAYTPDPELVRMLTNNGTKKWRVDKDEPGHLGVSAADVFTPAWWAAPPNDKAGLGIYDDVYTFNVKDNVFTHTTNNDLFGKKEYLKDFDPSLSGTGDYTLTGPKAADYTETFGYDGNATQEFITFAVKGHLGLYLGVHKYQVLERTDTHMTLRCVQDPGAWYVKLIAIQ
ncbi:PKD domain-containing protein [Chitinophaga qingshengii]|uniref:PKD domain-containing protein n=1 Tax=Chitinophaga qingshengii TaxID=1569794 RepID=A0ABR7TM58_9BACT|nr:PKD domain-containing protein [Chitinophaga qingshengii]MBC9930613.1 PKD domain-containing protein [Chitinophaga qingshengii]